MAVEWARLPALAVVWAQPKSLRAPLPHCRQLLPQLPLPEPSPALLLLSLAFALMDAMGELALAWMRPAQEQHRP